MQLVLNADQIFGALADATRRDIVLRALNGDEGVAELAGHYSMSFAAVQKHVTVLERAQLVTKQRRGREQIVSANRPRLTQAAALIDEFERIWVERVGRIDDILTAQKGTPS